LLCPLARRQRLAALLRRHRIPALPDGPVIEIGRTLAETVLHTLPRRGGERVEITSKHLVMSRARLRPPLCEGRRSQQRRRHGSADQAEKSTSRHLLSPRFRRSAGSAHQTPSVPRSQ
jgi:hypothetical protein